MRVAVRTAVLIVALVLAAAPAAAQFRGELSSRPSAPGRVPHPAPLPSVLALPLLSPSGLVTLSEGDQVAPAVVGEGAPDGGVQLDIQPWSAEVYVDGKRAGRVEQFRGYFQNLTLPAGPHMIALIANGYDPMIFPVTVIPGRTITYRATLQR